MVAKTQTNIKIIPLDDRGCYHKIQGFDNVDSVLSEIHGE